MASTLTSKSLNLLVGSQAEIKANRSGYTKSHCLRLCKHKLLVGNSVHIIILVYLYHIGIEGNEDADESARSGASRNTIPLSCLKQ